MKEINLGTTKTKPFDDFLLIPLSKVWLEVNDGNSLEFEAKLTEKGNLELTARLAALVNSKDVDNNETQINT